MRAREGPLIYSLLLFRLLAGPPAADSYYVVVNIDRKGQNPDRTYMITNKKSTNLCPEGYEKYVTERPDCFSVGSVRLGDDTIKVEGKEIVLHYVYGIESYWKHNTPVMIRFIKYHGWYTRVYPCYVLTESGTWKAENTYYYERSLTTGNLRLVLDEVCVKAKDIIEKQRSQGGSVGEEGAGGEEREFILFEGDKLKDKKAGFEGAAPSVWVFLLVLCSSLLYL